MHATGSNCGRSQYGALATSFGETCGGLRALQMGNSEGGHVGVVGIDSRSGGRACGCSRYPVGGRCPLAESRNFQRSGNAANASRLPAKSLNPYNLPVPESPGRAHSQKSTDRKSGSVLFAAISDLFSGFRNDRRVLRLTVWIRFRIPRLRAELPEYTWSSGCGAPIRGGG